MNVRVGLAGCGRLAERGYAPAFGLARGVRLVAVADPVLERCEHVAPGIPAYESAEAMLAGGGIDALLIATPPEAHVGDARAAAAVGVPSLVEKPPGIDAREAAELARLDPVPFVGFNRRFEPDLVRLRRKLARQAELLARAHADDGAGLVGAARELR